jgi:hypothetical protein
MDLLNLLVRMRARRPKLPISRLPSTRWGERNIPIASIPAADAGVVIGRAAAMPSGWRSVGIACSTAGFHPKTDPGGPPCSTTWQSCIAITSPSKVQESSPSRRAFSLPPTVRLPISKRRPGLKVLEVELQVHLHLENNVLFPRAIALQHKYTLRLARSTSSAETESCLP